MLGENFSHQTGLFLLTRFVLFIWSVLQGALAFGQSSYYLLYDSLNKRGIPVCKVILDDTTYYSDSFGRFQKFTFNTDSLCWECPGYKSGCLKLNEIGDSIFVRALPIELPEIIISSNQQDVELGYHTKRSSTSFLAIPKSVLKQNVVESYFTYLRNPYSQLIIDEILFQMKRSKLIYAVRISCYAAKDEKNVGEFLWSSEMRTEKNKRKQGKKISTDLLIDSPGFFIGLEVLSDGAIQINDSTAKNSMLLRLTEELDPNYSYVLGNNLWQPFEPCQALNNRTTLCPTYNFMIGVSGRANNED